MLQHQNKMLPYKSFKPTHYCLQLLAFVYILNIVRAQLPNDPQSYQPRYNPQYTNTQQNPQQGSTQFDNPLLPSTQDQQQLGGNTNTPAGGSGLGQTNYNNYFDSQSNLNRPLSTNTFSSFDSQSNNNPLLGSQNTNYDPFNRNTQNANNFASNGFGYVDSYSDELNYCPEHWISYRQTCYRFIRSPKRNWLEAKKICKAYQAELLNVDNIEKHGFILKNLILQNQNQNRFWTSAHQTGPNNWINDDNSPFLMIEDSFSFDEAQAIENEDLHDNRFLVKDSFNDFNNQNRNQNPNQYYNTIGGSANRNQNNLRGFIGE